MYREIKPRKGLFEGQIDPKGKYTALILSTIAVKGDITNHVWITAAGQEIPVREMRTQHINRTINCWHGKGKTKIPKGYLGGKQKWLRIFHEELIRRN